MRPLDLNTQQLTANQALQRPANGAAPEQPSPAREQAREQARPQRDTASLGRGRTSSLRLDEQSYVDINGDGKISRNEKSWVNNERVQVQRLEEKFERLDQGGDGVLSGAEMRRHHRRLDTDGDNKVSKQEYLVGHTIEAANESFKRLDRNKDKRLTGSALRKYSGFNVSRGAAVTRDEFQKGRLALAGLSAQAPQRVAPPSTDPAPVRDAQPTPGLVPPHGTQPAPAPAPEVQPTPSNDGKRRVMLQENFDGPDRVFVHQNDYWGSKDGGRSQNPVWSSESGELRIQNGKGVTNSQTFRMWTRRNDLDFAKAEMNVRFDGFSGSRNRHTDGITMWMNRKLNRPTSKDPALHDGETSGYMMDFNSRDGKVYILKKVEGDTRKKWPKGALAVVNVERLGKGTYYMMGSAKWSPETGRTYRYSTEVVNNKNNTATLRIQVDGKTILETVDDGKSIAGPVLTGGRVGLRSDSSRMAVDNLTISK